MHLRVIKERKEVVRGEAHVLSAGDPILRGSVRSWVKGVMEEKGEGHQRGLHLIQELGREDHALFAAVRILPVNARKNRSSNQGRGHQLGLNGRIKQGLPVAIVGVRARRIGQMEEVNRRVEERERAFWAWRRKILILSAVCKDLRRRI